MSCSNSISSLLRQEAAGLYCPQGDFYIDPQKPVQRALITHGHSDHARPRMQHYLTSESGRPIVQERVGSSARVEGIPYGQSLKIKDVRVSFHPAGHVLGSSQIRIEYKGFVCVHAGDYKTEADASCQAFELLPCNQFITESTFALPVYRWEASASIFSEINKWWKENQTNGITSVLYAYALGKAQRVLAGVDASIGPIGVHASVERFNRHYREQGYLVPDTIQASRNTAEHFAKGGLIIAPASTQDSSWLRQFKPYAQAFASGWMAVRGLRRRRALDSVFVLSDHVDWKGITETIRATGAEHIGVCHGYSDALVRWLKEHEGLNAKDLSIG